jgi:hypothetical protein
LPPSSRRSASASTLPARRARVFRDLFYAWLAATALSGIPSTLYAFLTGGDVTEATRAAGAMLIAAESSMTRLFLAAAVVHSLVSAFWAAILFFILPRRHMLLWALIASAAIGMLALLVIAPRLFPEVAALAFWPQMADHLMWGACLGGVLQWRSRSVRA